MKIFSTFGLIVLLALCLQDAAADEAVECNATHFDLIGNYTLGKQDELNKTFTLMQPKIKDLGNVTFQASQTTQYIIYNAVPTFFYRDSNQKAEILGNDTIVVYGGRLQVDISFNWTKKSVITRNGTGIASGLSDVLDFAKSIIIENRTSYGYDLLDYSPVQFTSEQGLALRRVDPADATDDDKVALRKMLNNIMGTKTIRNLLEDEIDKIFAYYLKASLHDEHHHIDPQFDYTWVPGNQRPNVTISLTRRPITVDVEPEGIKATFQVQVQNSTTWICGNRPVSTLPLNPDVFGHTQQFISYDFYDNFLRHSISKNLLDATLDRQNWESRMFQFYVGDLYEIIPALQTKFYASAVINGNCKATYTGFKVFKGSHDSFNVTIHFDCELNVQRQKILDFAVGLQIEVAPHPRARTIDFRIRRHDQFSYFFDYQNYKVTNKPLAELMVKHSLNRLYDNVLFGSGWPISPPRDYPHFVAEQNHTIVYDSTHVGDIPAKLQTDLIIQNE